MEKDINICPKTWLLPSILVTLFCCIPFGIVGLVNACSVSTAFAEGNYDLAYDKSRTAGKWVKIGFWCGLCIWLVLFAIEGTAVYYIIQNHLITG